MMRLAAYIDAQHSVDLLILYFPPQQLAHMSVPETKSVWTPHDCYCLVLGLLWTLDSGL